MLKNAFLVTATFLAAGPLSAQETGAPPYLDAESHCRESGGVEEQIACVSAEQAAYDAMASGWASYAPEDASACETQASETGSYAVMRACLTPTGEDADQPSPGVGASPEVMPDMNVVDPPQPGLVPPGAAMGDVPGQDSGSETNFGGKPAIAERPPLALE